MGVGHFIFTTAELPQVLCTSSIKIEIDTDWVLNINFVKKNVQPHFAFTANTLLISVKLNKSLERLTILKAYFANAEKAFVHSYIF